MKKRILILLLLIMLLTVSVHGGTCGEDLSWSLSGGTLTISGTGDMQTLWDEGNPPWYGERASITGLVVEEGVTSIGPKAFQDCENLHQVELPESLTRIGANAFENCASLEQIALPDGIMELESRLFYGCTSLKRVEIPESVTVIGANVFRDCGALTELKLPGSLEILENYALAGCTGLAALTLPEGLREIGQYAFCGCTGLLTLDIPDSVTEIGCKAFLDCVGLEHVTLPAGLTEIKKETFRGCTGLKEISIPESVTVVDESAFYGCTVMEEVRLPGTVETVADYAFINCAGILRVRLDDCREGFGAMEIGLKNHCLTEAPEKLYETHQAVYTDAVPPTCTETGTAAHWACESCGGIFGDEACEKPLRAEELSVPSTGHSFGEADCSAPATCEICGATEGEPLGHDYDEGVITLEPTEEAEGEKTFTCQRCGDTYVEPVPVITNPENPFVDVVEGKFYYDSVLWAAENGITSGITPTEFRPGMACTRGHVVTFLWRAAGCPEPETEENPFTDVDEGRFYYKAVLWAAENGITAGITPTEFWPEETCTRGQVVTFLYRFAGAPEPSLTDNPFEDVDASRFYYKAVLWAVETGVTQGMKPNEFAPGGSCTRGHVVTFLYRYMTQ